MLLILRNSVVCFDKRKRRRIQVCSPLVCSVSFYFLLDNISVSYAILVSLHEDLNREPSIASFVQLSNYYYPVARNDPRDRLVYDFDHWDIGILSV